MDIYKKRKSLIEKEEEFKKILKSSLPGTLAHSLSKFYLTIIEIVKKSKNAKLIDGDLENVAGGASFKSRFIASLTAFLSLVSANPAALATDSDSAAPSGNVVSYKKSLLDEHENIIVKVKAMSDEEVKTNLALAPKLLNEKYKTFSKGDTLGDDASKATPKLFKPAFEQVTDLTEDRKNLAEYMYFSVLMENYPEYLNLKSDEIWQFKDLSDDEIQNLIEAEKKRFKKLGTIDGVEYFKIEKDIEKSISPKIFVITLRKINNILEKHSKLTNKLANLEKEYKAVFKIHSFGTGTDISKTPGSAMPAMYINGFYCTQKHSKYRFFNVFLSKDVLRDAGWAFSVEWANKLAGFQSYAEANQLIASLVAHEMGHVFEFILHRMACKISEQLYIELDLFNNAMKEKIIKIAKEKYGATGSKISEYGETNVREWFAEVFANLECSNEENISPHGKAMRDVLKMFEDETITNEELRKNLLNTDFNSKT